MKIKLTKRFIDNAKAEKAGENSKRRGEIVDTLFFDSDLIGFGLKVTPLGRKTYFVQYRHEGRKRRLSIGPHGSPWTPDMARQKAVEVLGLVSSGEDPAEAKQESKKAITVSELCDLYLKDGVTTKKESTLEIDRGRIEHHIKPILGRKKVVSVTRVDVQRLLRDVAAGKTARDIKTGPRGRAIVKGGQGSANRVVGLFGGILSFAVDRGIRPDNPKHGVKTFTEPKRDRFLSAQELARLGETLTAAEGEGVNPSAINAIRLMVLTGCRKSEILKLRWREVDFDFGCLRLPDSKTGQKVVQIGPPVFELLNSLPRIKGNPYVIPGEKAGGHFVGLAKVWAKIKKQADLSDVRPHDLRHAFASVAVVGGAGLPVIGKLLGHKHAATTARYAHLSDDPLKDAANRISSTIAAHMNGQTKENVVPMKEAAQ
ncbi:MAG: tyrosine-type recombinase/integrase [Magnetococcales bacterium]|nr:tyrosine-type recombinase/integrase [Magnetococcales bacterium]